ncbi:MAG: hypothetical protein IJE07_06905 [Clostridia bacterium]|nr:hypothetical protein [Clostridia bacterium]
MKEVTPISHEASQSLPDPQAQTDQLHAALEKTITDLRQSDTAHAALIAGELAIMADTLEPPPESYPGLAELDKAIADALPHLDELSAYAPLTEVQQSLKTLRRILLVNRSTIDPDPDRHQLSTAVALRHVWLIGHRAGLLKANMQQLALSQKLSSGSVSSEDHARYREALDLLEQYISAQEGYGASVRQELEDLTARILF